MPSTSRRYPRRLASTALVPTFANPIVSKTDWTYGSGSTEARHAFHRPRQHFLGSTARRNQADADLDQADVRLRRGLDAIGVQDDLAAAAEREPGRRDDDRNGRVPSDIVAF